MIHQSPSDISAWVLRSYPGRVTGEEIHFCFFVSLAVQHQQVLVSFPLRQGSLAYDLLTIHNHKPSLSHSPYIVSVYEVTPSPSIAEHRRATKWDTPSRVGRLSKILLVDVI